MQTVVPSAPKLHQSPPAVAPVRQSDSDIDLSRSTVVNGDHTSIQPLIDALKTWIPARAENFGRDWGKLQLAALNIAHGVSWIEAASGAADASRFQLLHFAVAGAGFAIKQSGRAVSPIPPLTLTQDGEGIRDKLLACGELVEQCTRHLLNIAKASVVSTEEAAPHRLVLKQTLLDATRVLNEVVKSLPQDQPAQPELSKRTA